MAELLERALAELQEDEASQKEHLSIAAARYFRCPYGHASGNMVFADDWPVDAICPEFLPEGRWCGAQLVERDAGRAAESRAPGLSPAPEAAGSVFYECPHGHPSGKAEKRGLWWYFAIGDGARFELGGDCVYCGHELDGGAICMAPLVEVDAGRARPRVASKEQGR